VSSRDGQDRRQDSAPSLRVGFTSRICVSTKRRLLVPSFTHVRLLSDMSGGEADVSEVRHPKDEAQSRTEVLLNEHMCRPISL
jgi:hypothetical protein